jgi:WAS family protein
VRQPHNARERQRQLAVRHGEYIMPQNIHYRTAQPLQQPDETLLTGMGMSEPRPPTPNRIDLRQSFPEQVDSVYSGSPRHTQSLTESHYRANYPVGYEESLVQQHYTQGRPVAGDSYSTPNNHTPSRSNRTRATLQDPAIVHQTVSVCNTPTRARGVSALRKTLPSPVEAIGSPPGMNGSLPSHIRSRSCSGS